MTKQIKKNMKEFNGKAVKFVKDLEESMKEVLNKDDMEEIEEKVLKCIARRFCTIYNEAINKCIIHREDAMEDFGHLFDELERYVMTDYSPSIYREPGTSEVCTI